jgi:hypothetical protein
MNLDSNSAARASAATIAFLAAVLPVIDEATSAAALDSTAAARSSANLSFVSTAASFEFNSLV